MNVLLIVAHGFNDDDGVCWYINVVGSFLISGEMFGEWMDCWMDDLMGVFLMGENVDRWDANHWSRYDFDWFIHWLNDRINYATFGFGAQILAYTVKKETSAVYSSEHLLVTLHSPDSPLTKHPI